MKKILVVDDDRFTLKIVSTTLGGAGYDVKTALDVRQAKTLIEAEDFDFLITDILMPPGEDGTKLIQAAKELNSAVRVLAMTAGHENAVDDYVNYADMFSDHTLAKPFEKQDLLQAMEQLAH